MSGVGLAQFALDPDAKFHALLDLIHQQLPLQVGRWTLILPAGESPDETQSELDVQSVFGLSYDV